ncbi:MarR family winged helix-turn-helix transcriptional regulator [Sedimenticola sp.]|uniref:MarR family winged helix-turn-helix transcriptional regulator n=1 Tax=Sedimenticola sp. TaxID=1940285 RepID=UPI003D1121F6
MSTQPTASTVLAWARLFRAYKVLLEQAERDLKKAGLPPLSWYDVLLEVHDAPAQRIRQFELGQKVLLPKYNLSRLLDRLQNEALLNREACAEDKRGAVITLTAKGRRLLKQMWSCYGATIHDRFEMRLDAKERDQLARVLLKLLPE